MEYLAHPWCVRGVFGARRHSSCRRTAAVIVAVFALDPEQPLAIVGMIVASPLLLVAPASFSTLSFYAPAIVLATAAATQRRSSVRWMVIGFGSPAIAGTTAWLNEIQGRHIFDFWAVFSGATLAIFLQICLIYPILRGLIFLIKSIWSFVASSRAAALSVVVLGLSVFAGVFAWRSDESQTDLSEFGHAARDSSDCVQAIKKILVEHLGVEPNKVTLQARLAKDLGADELDILEIIMALEHEFRAEIPGDIVDKFVTVEDVVGYADQQVAAVL